MARQGLPDAQAVQPFPDGHRVGYAGLVISRQRPSTAQGTVFVTLEDETGFVNVIVWHLVWHMHDIYDDIPLSFSILPSR